MSVKFAMRPNFPAAFIVAIAAGGAAAFLLSIVMIPLMGSPSEANLGVAAIAAAAVAVYALIICFAYTLVLGLGAVIYVRMTRRVPKLRTAVILGVLAGSIPLVVFLLLQEGGSPSRFDVLFTPVLAVGCAMASAWSFWAVGLRGRTVS